MIVKRLNYILGDNGASRVNVSFEDWDDQSIQYNIIVMLTTDDIDLESSTPQQIADVAKLKFKNLLEGE